jgi:hypothetical protein
MGYLDDQKINSQIFPFFMVLSLSFLLLPLWGTGLP